MENVLHSPEYDIKSIVSCAFLVNPFRVSARFETQQLYFVCWIFVYCFNVDTTCRKEKHRAYCNSVRRPQGMWEEGLRRCLVLSVFSKGTAGKAHPNAHTGLFLLFS